MVKVYTYTVPNKRASLTKIKVEGNCNLKYVDSETRCLVRQRDCLKKKANQTGSEYLSQAFQQFQYIYEISVLVITETKSTKTRRH